MDLVIVRENTEGFYADRNMFVGSGEFMAYSRRGDGRRRGDTTGCERIAHTAFGLAMRRRKRVTVVHKANVLATTTGLFRDVCRDVAPHYPDVRLDDEHVDAMAAYLVRRGEDYDVVVTENMFGDILSDLAAELSGSLGTAASITRSETKGDGAGRARCGPDISGRNRANHRRALPVGRDASRLDLGSPQRTGVRRRGRAHP